MIFFFSLYILVLSEFLKMSTYYFYNQIKHPCKLIIGAPGNICNLTYILDTDLFTI